MENFTLIIFGITGNLAQSKLLPALVKLEEKKLLPSKMKIIGIARHTPNIPEVLKKRFELLEGDVEKDSTLFKRLKEKLTTSDYKNHLYYLATYPNLYASIFSSLKENGLNEEKGGWTRLIIEKPLGNNYKSAKSLNNLLSKYFKESQIFRIDHYLGKETLQNILIFRFANTLFEPILNKTYVDHIQISALEERGIEGRGGYFDSTGTLRDVGQNHLLQMLAAATCEAPLEFTNEEITQKRLEVLKSLKASSNDIIFGQYENYQKEVNVIKNS